MREAAPAAAKLLLCLLLAALAPATAGCGTELPPGLLDMGGGGEDGGRRDIRRVDAPEDLPRSGPCGEGDAPDRRHEALSADETWGPGRHFVPAPLAIPAGTTLTIAPCAEVLFAAGARLDVAGTLRAAGEKGRPLRMRLDPASPANHWLGVVAERQSRVELTHVQIDRGDVGVLVQPGASVRLVSVEIVGSRRAGLWLDGPLAQGSGPVTIHESEGVPVLATAASVGSLPQGSYLGNGDDVVEISSGSAVVESALWPDLGIPYRASFLLVEAPPGRDAPRLTLGAGARLELRGELLVRGGELQVRGTDVRPVEITGPDDDGGQKTRAVIRAMPPARGLTLEHARLEQIAVVAEAGSVAIDDVVASRSCGPTFTLVNGAGFATGSLGLTVAEARSCEVGEATSLPGVPLLLDPGAVAGLPVGRYVGNQMDAVLVRGGSVTSNVSWASPGVPYRLAGPLFVEGQDAPTLVLGRGVSLEALSPSVGIYVGMSAPGTLVVEAAPEAPVRLASARLVPAAGDWVGLVFGPLAGPRSRLIGAEVTHAGAADPRRTSCATPGDGAPGGVVLYDVKVAPVIAQTLVSDSAGWGIALDVASLATVPDYTAPKLGNFFERNVLGAVSEARTCP